MAARYAPERPAQQMPTANDIHDLVAPYALDALDAEERAEFERHLAECEPCSRELRELQDTAASLAWATTGPEPPPDLRSRILDRARGEAQVIPFERRRRWVTPALGAVAAVAAVVAIGLGLWGASLSNDLDQERDLRSAQDRALQIVGDRGAQVVSLKGSDGSLVVARNGRAALVVCGLGQAPSGETYVAWTIRGTPSNAGAFDASDDGCTAAPLDHTVAPGVTVAVTREQDPNVQLPTTDPLFTAQAA
jgi:anti-sigma factor RsiW